MSAQGQVRQDQLYFDNAGGPCMHVGLSSMILSGSKRARADKEGEGDSTGAGTPPWPGVPSAAALSESELASAVELLDVLMADDEINR